MASNFYKTFDLATNARAPPIYHGADLFGLRAFGNICRKPDSILEKRVAALERGAAAPQFMAIGAIAGAGDNIVSTSYLYGGVRDPRTTNSKVDTPRDGKQNYVAHEHKIPLVIDNTFGMGHGADIVVHSAIKWIGVHDTTIAGVIENSTGPTSGRFLSFTSPSEGYHGIKFSEMFGNLAFVTKLRIEALRDIGAFNPFAAFLLLQGLETLSLRAQRHCDNALARYLKQHEKVAWVSYMGLASHQLALKTLRPNAFGGVLSFGVKDGEDAAVSVGIENIQDTMADFEGALKDVS
ncbi:O-acetylhomoserine ami [Lactarius sanguifluus]|nr:O-acetylhomoserine ami [Lactarius sanguifluus]